MCPVHHQFCLVALNCPPLLLFCLAFMRKVKQTALFCGPEWQQSHSTARRGALGKAVTAGGRGMLSGAQPPPVQQDCHPSL